MANKYVSIYLLCLLTSIELDGVVVVVSYEFILRSLPHQAQVTNRFLDQSYVYDIRAGNHAGPIVDEFNFFDYEVAQNATHTSVSFSKRLDTGDASGVCVFFYSKSLVPLTFIFRI